MKYLEIYLVLMCINLAFSAIVTLGILPISPDYNDSYILGNTINSTEFASDYTVNKSDNIGYKFNKDVDSASYSKTLLQTNVFQDVDFLTGIWIFIEIVGKGIFYLGPTLTVLGVPPQLHNLFIIPYIFMFLLGLFQVFSGRNVEANK